MAVSKRTKFLRSDGVDGDHVLAHIESHPEIEELHCEQVVSDQHVEAMDRLLVNYHSAISLSSLALPQNGLTAAVGHPVANILQRQHETLQRLDLSHNPITSVGLSDLMVPLLESNPPLNLISLNLTDTQLGTRGASSIASLLRHNTTLRELYIGKNNLGTRGLKTIAPELAENSTLRILDVSYNNVRSRGAAILAQVIENSTSTALKVLDITCNKIGVAGIQSFAKLLVLDRQIEGFFAGCNSLGPEGSVHLAAALKHNYTLRDLRLADNQIGDDGTTLLIQNIMENDASMLERLDLGWNGIGLEGTAWIAEALKVNSKLCHVDLTGNQVCSGGAQALAESLRYNLSLNELKLTHNQIDNPGAFALALALAKSTCPIKHICWQENPISEEGLQSLERVPELRRNQQHWLGPLLKDLTRGNVASINLSNRRIGDEEVLILADALGSTTPLIRSVWLDGTALTSRSVVPFLEHALSPPSNILRLYVRKCKNMGDDIARPLETILAQNTTLEVLSLSDCEITPTGAAAIANGLSKNQTLRRLNLDRNMIGDAGFMTLLQTMLPHPSIVSISASRNGITDQSMTMENIKYLQEIHLVGNNITDRGALELCQFLMGDDCKLKWISLGKNQLTKRGGGTISSFLPSDEATVDF